MIDALNRYFNPWKRRILLMLGGAIIKAVKDSEKIQSVQLSAMDDELLDNIPRVQEFGFSSVPPAGAEAVIACMGGNRADMMVIGTDSSAHRPRNLKTGECVLYNAHGIKVYLKNDKLRLTTKEYDTDVDALIDAILNHTHIYLPGPSAPVATTAPDKSPAMGTPVTPYTSADFKKGDN